MNTNCQRYYIALFISFFVFCLGACTGKGAHTQTEEKSEMKAKADSLLDVMYDNNDAQKYAEAVVAGMDALRLYEELKDTAGLSEVLGSISVSHLRLGNEAEALECSFRAIELDSIKKNYDYLSGDYNTIASIYLTEGKPAQAEPFVLRAIEYEKISEEKAHLSNRYGIASEIYCKMGRVEEAIKYATQGYEIAVERKDTIQMGTRMSQLADTYLAEGRYADAEKMYRNCIAMMQSPRSRLSLAITYKQLGNLSLRRNDEQQAIAYFEKGAQLAREIKYMMLLMQCTQQLGELTAATRPAYSVEMLKESRALADTLHSHKVEEIMASFAAKFDKQEKERTIAEQAESLLMHKRIIWAGAILLVLMVLIIVLNVYMYRLRLRNERLQADISKKVVEETQHLELSAISDEDQEFLDEMADFVKKNLADSSLSTSTLAEEFCMSSRQFSRRVKLLTDIDTTHYIRASRILYARQLLSETTLPVSEIYVKCGFESANYFARVFKQDVGVSPTEYRKVQISKVKSEE